MLLYVMFVLHKRKTETLGPVIVKHSKVQRGQQFLSYDRNDNHNDPRQSIVVGEKCEFARRSQVMRFQTSFIADVTEANVQHPNNFYIGCSNRTVIQRLTMFDRK